MTDTLHMMRRLGTVLAVLCYLCAVPLAQAASAAPEDHCDHCDPRLEHAACMLEGLPAAPDHALASAARDPSRGSPVLTTPMPGVVAGPVAPRRVVDRGMHGPPWPPPPLRRLHLLFGKLTE